MSPPGDDPVATALLHGFLGRHTIVVTGLVLQEVLQGLSGARARPEIIRRFRYLESLVPTLDDHVAAADVRTVCRRRGVQVDTVDALLAALCLRRGLTLLTADQDFTHIAGVVDLKIWEPSAA